MKLTQVASYNIIASRLRFRDKTEGSGMNKLIFALAPLCASAMMISAGASAQVTTLNFEGIATYPNDSGTQILSYYNGGAAGNGAIGPNLGVAFTSGAQLLCLNTAGTSCSNTSKGGTGVAGSDQYAMFFQDLNPFMNVAAGFSNAFSFAYTDPFAVGTTVSVYSGLDGGGTLLGSATLPGTSGSCPSEISGGATYCPFSNFSVAFSGTAQSVLFGGPTNAQVFDDFTFGSAVVGGAVPEPSTWAMMLLGFAAVGYSMRRRSYTVALAS